ncbi:MAG: putative aminohydrolase SsnA [Phycisphaerae bacterium]|nr:putative aminohydrolase SsnA [Phycisphaerae bacterium]
MNTKTLISNGIVVTLGNNPQVIEDGAVLIRGNLIEQVGRRDEVSAEGCTRIDAGGGVIMPGLINAHNHFYSTFACGIALKDDPPANFVEILERLWWRLDKALTLEDVRYSSLIPLCRGLRAGTTTVFDHHASPTAIRGSLETIAKAAGEVGVRTCLCYEVSDRDGPDTMRRGLDENVTFLKAHHDNGEDTMLSAMFGLHASMTLSEETLFRASELGRELNAGFHIHTAESTFDQKDSLGKYGARVVRRLADADMLGDKTICAHCIHLDDAEFETLLDSGTNVVHNPQSNMNNAVGAAAVLRMLSMGVQIGLGTDAMTANMFDELRVAHLLQKHVTADPRAGFVEACRMLFENNRRIASKFFTKPIGVLEPGCLADVIVVGYTPATPLHMDNLWGHMMFGVPTAPVRLAMVNGQLRMRDGVVLGVDEEEVAIKSRELARRMWERW